MKILLGRVPYVAGFSLLRFWLYYATSFWPVKFLPEKWSDGFVGFLCIWLFFLAPFMPCVGWFGVVLFGILRVSCTWESVSFRFRKFSAIISSSTVLMPFSFSGIPIMWILAQFILSHRSCMLFFLAFPPPRPLSFFCSGWVNYSVFQTTYAFFCVINCTSISVCYSLLLECFFMSVTALSIFDWVFIVILVPC